LQERLGCAGSHWSAFRLCLTTENGAVNRVLTRRIFYLYALSGCDTPASWEGEGSPISSTVLSMKPATKARKRCTSAKVLARPNDTRTALAALP
jgi:hypothetical protein